MSTTINPSTSSVQVLEKLAKAIKLPKGITFGDIGFSSVRNAMSVYKPDDVLAVVSSFMREGWRADIASPIVLTKVTSGAAIPSLRTIMPTLTAGYETIVNGQAIQFGKIETFAATYEPGIHVNDKGKAVANSPAGEPLVVWGYQAHQIIGCQGDTVAIVNGRTRMLALYIMATLGMDLPEGVQVVVQEVTDTIKSVSGKELENLHKSLSREDLLTHAWMACTREPELLRNGTALALRLGIDPKRRTVVQWLSAAVRYLDESGDGAAFTAGQYKEVSIPNADPLKPAKVYRSPMELLDREGGLYDEVLKLVDRVREGAAAGVPYRFEGKTPEAKAAKVDESRLAAALTRWPKLAAYLKGTEAGLTLDAVEATIADAYVTRQAK